MTHSPETNLAAARRYLQALERLETGEALAAYFTPDTVQEEFPNRLTVNGARRDLAALLAGSERGQKLMARQEYEVRNALALDNTVVLEVRWTGTLALDAGTLKAGDQMKAYFAVILEYRDGLIAAQRNYDCFEPW